MWHLGHNGSGKSTLLRLIAGTEAPDAGLITRTGRISWPLGFAGSFNGSLSGAENCLFVARIYGQDTEYVLDFVREFSELGSFFRMPVNSYSSGMRARLAFGVSMAIAFDYYLVDAITAVAMRNSREVPADLPREAFQVAHHHGFAPVCHIAQIL